MAAHDRFRLRHIASGIIIFRRLCRAQRTGPYRLIPTRQARASPRVCVAVCSRCIPSTISGRANAVFGGVSPCHPNDERKKELKAQYRRHNSRDRIQFETANWPKGQDAKVRVETHRGTIATLPKTESGRAGTCGLFFRRSATDLPILQSERSHE